MSVIHGTHFRNWLLSLPPVEFVIQQLREALIGALRCGPIPEHVAFVMDGNRRWARKSKVETVEGHNMGFEALARILEVCYKSGVRVVTIYAFSIENFKRSKYEVDGLMDMAKTKLLQLSQHGELLDRYGASVRILGDTSLMREDVQEQINRAVEMTKHNQSAVLNVCFPYTGREEITHSVRETVREFTKPATRPALQRPFSETHIQRNILSRQLPVVEEEDHYTRDHFATTREDGSTLTFDEDDCADDSVSEHDLETSSTFQPASSQTSHSTSPVLKPASRPAMLPDPESITTDTITKNTYTSTAPPLDLLIRTSGVQRLSDFMLWQCHETTEIRFLECLWPEFDLWHFLPVLVDWQWRQKKRAERDVKSGVGAKVA